MARALGLVPLNVAIVERDGTITEFFRERWEELRVGATTSPFVGEFSADAQTAALATTAVHTTIGSGRYRISYYIRKTTADGVSSSLTVTLGWIDGGVTLTETFTALTTDAITAQQSGSKVVESDGNADLTIAVAYASNTPGAMTWKLDAVVEQL